MAMDSPCSDWGFPSRVSPFRNLRVFGYLLLTAAYRSLSRLSSALSAKASTLRPFQLDLLNRIMDSTESSDSFPASCRLPFLSIYSVICRLEGSLNVNKYEKQSVALDIYSQCFGYLLLVNFFRLPALFGCLTKSYSWNNV